MGAEIIDLMAALKGSLDQHGEQPYAAAPPNPRRPRYPAGRQSAEPYRVTSVTLDPAADAALEAARQPGESRSAAVARIIVEHRNCLIGGQAAQQATGEAAP